MGALTPPTLHRRKVSGARSIEHSTHVVSPLVHRWCTTRYKRPRTVQNLQPDRRKHCISHIFRSPNFSTLAMLEAASPRYWSTESTPTRHPNPHPQQQQATMDNSSQHKKMSGSANHDWLIALQQGMQRSASKRGRHLMVEPVSPTSDRCLLRKSQSRARLMTDPQDQSPARQNRSTLRKPTLSRRVTAPCAGDELCFTPDFDVPLEVSILPSQSENEQEDDISEISIIEDEEFDWGKSYDVADTSLITDTTHIMESSGSSALHGWGISTVCLDDFELSPSAEGSCAKQETQSIDDLPPMMLQLCSLDDERQDCSMMALHSKDSVFGEALDENRQEHPYVI